jgi:tyrosyl-tRNA synthetase
MWRWYELLSLDRTLADIGRLRQEVAGGQLHPRDAKLALARELAQRFRGAAEAEQAVAQWNALVREQRVDVDLPLQEIAVPPDGLRIAPLLVAAGLAGSNSEAARKIGERAVRLDGSVVEARDLVLAAGAEHLLQVGKRHFARVRLAAVADAGAGTAGGA